MNKEPKIISFKDLIDLEPKPKKVKYDTVYFNYDRKEKTYYKHDCNEYQLTSYFNFGFDDMKEPNIEIIEEDVVIEKTKKIIKLNDNTPDQAYTYSQCWGSKELIFVHKINEIIDLLNKKGQGND